MRKECGRENSTAHHYAFHEIARHGDDIKKTMIKVGKHYCIARLSRQLVLSGIVYYKGRMIA